MKKRALITLTFAGLLSTTSCLGPNNAFNGIHSWNSRVTDSRWWNGLIHAGMWIVPVYQFTLLGDIVIFNTIEFWGGESPIGEPKEFEPQGEK